MNVTLIIQLRGNSFTNFSVSKLAFNSVFFFLSRWEANFLHRRELRVGHECATLKFPCDIINCRKFSTSTFLQAIFAVFFLFVLFYPLHLYQSWYRRSHCRSSHTISVYWGRASRGVSCPDQMDRKKAISNRSDMSMWYVGSAPAVSSANRATSNTRIIKSDKYIA